MRIDKDTKGSCFIVSHRRCGYYESIFLTMGELRELFGLIDSVLGDEQEG